MAAYPCPPETLQLEAAQAATTVRRSAAGSSQMAAGEAAFLSRLAELPVPAALVALHQQEEQRSAV